MSVHQRIAKIAGPPFVSFEGFMVLVAILFGWLAFSNNSPFMPAVLGMLAVGLAYTVPIGFVVIRASLRSRVGRPNAQVFMASILLMVGLLIVTIVGLGTQGHGSLNLVFMTGLSLALFHAISLTEKPERALEILGLSGVAVLIIAAIAWGWSGFPSGWTFFFGNPNSFGLVVATNAAISMLFIKSYTGRGCVIALSLVFLVFVTAKTALLLYICFLFVYLVWPVVTKSRVRFNIFTFLVALLVVVLPYLYIEFSASEVGKEIDFYIRLLFFESRFFSGRERIWPQVIADIRENWILGSGAVPVVLKLDGMTLSAHNLYLTLLYQGGVVFLGLFLLLLYFVAARFYRIRHLRRARFAGAFLTAFLFAQVFEIAIFQNNLSLSFWLWMILGLGVAPGRQALARGGIYKPIDMAFARAVR